MKFSFKPIFNLFLDVFTITSALIILFVIVVFIVFAISENKAFGFCGATKIASDYNVVLENANKVWFVDVEEMEDRNEIWIISKGYIGGYCAIKFDAITKKSSGVRFGGI